MADRPSRPAGARWDLPALLTTAEAKAPRAERHTWLVRLAQWLRQPDRRGERLLAEAGSEAGLEGMPGAPAAAAPLAAIKLRHLAAMLERNPEAAQRVGGLLQRILDEADTVPALADFGFAPHPGVVVEGIRRLGRRLRPPTPDTADGAELLLLLRLDGRDAAWLGEIDGPTLDRLAGLLQGDAAAAPSAAALEAVARLAAQVRVAGGAPALRSRIDPELAAAGAFEQLVRGAERWRDAVQVGDTTTAAQEAAMLHAVLGRCQACADSVRAGLQDQGISVTLVHELDLLHRRTVRISDLMALAMARLPGSPPGAWHDPLRHLLCQLAHAAGEQRSVRALLREHGALLSRRVAERNAETGAHYITRTRAEHRWMLRAAAGGGAIIAGTTFIKFGLLELGLGAFWSGFWAGANYAASFLLVMALHFTVATKQPAMTAPALARQLTALDDPAALERFVDEVVHLIRSQVAGIVGNLGAVIPVVLAVQAAAWWVFGRPLIDEAHARHVLQDLTLLGPTVLFAAFTGVLLFVSSILAGWAENAFVWYRLDSALAHNPWIVDRLGAARARRWADWWRANVSGVTANVGLGMMLGLVPVLLQGLGLPLQVRHVTLSTGQLSAAVGTLGVDALRHPAFGWCVAGILATGVLNLAVSFGLAFQVALRARGLDRAERAGDRALLRAALWRRAWRQPLGFVWPPPDRAQDPLNGGSAGP